MAKLRPAKHDHVYVSARDLAGLNPYGRIIRISHEEVCVKFFGTISKNMLKINPSLHIPAQWIAGGGDYEEYSLVDFGGTWSSHDGGEGEWQL